MADRELRHMSRTELVEIIYALKQSEDALRKENEALAAQLQDRQIHIQKAGSIAQAALELNHVFEAAQAAADEYLASVREADRTAEQIRAAAREDAEQIRAAAMADAAALKARTEAECRALRAAQAAPKES